MAVGPRQPQPLERRLSVRQVSRQLREILQYNLDSSTKLSDFNLEQQAAIIEDYYLVSKNLLPDSNVGTRKTVPDYVPDVEQLKTAGPFRWPVTNTSNRDNIGNKI